MRLIAEQEITVDEGTPVKIPAGTAFTVANSKAAMTMIAKKQARPAGPHEAARPPLETSEPAPRGKKP